jgi:hypothetical protein
MRIDTALLCDAVTVRDGLLHVLGGGITQAARPEYPAPLGMHLALRVLLHPTEIERPHQVEILLQDEDGEMITRAQIGIQVPPDAAIPAGEEASIPIPWTFPMQPALPHAGRYSFEVLIDGVHQVSVPFTALELQQQQGGEPE